MRDRIRDLENRGVFFFISLALVFAAMIGIVILSILTGGQL